MTTPILHFSDVLCIFAYVAQARVEELERSFGDAIDVAYHFCSVFGEPERRFADKFREQGGVQGYNRHVLTVAARYPHLTVHPEVWTKQTPKSSLAPHLFLRAIGVAEARQETRSGALATACATFRSAFFQEARNIADSVVQRELLEELSIDGRGVENALNSAEAHAALARDFELSRQHDVTVSPTLLFNEGRQRLNGNVGFRIIEANVREFLRAPAHEASWC